MITLNDLITRFNKDNELAELTDREATQKLFKLIQIFNDRNPVVVARS